MTTNGPTNGAPDSLSHPVPAALRYVDVDLFRLATPVLSGVNWEVRPGTGGSCSAQTGQVRRRSSSWLRVTFTRHGAELKSSAAAWGASTYERCGRRSLPFRLASPA